MHYYEIIQLLAGGERETPHCVWTDNCPSDKTCSMQTIAQGRELHERSWILSDLWVKALKQACNDCLDGYAQI